MHDTTFRDLIERALKVRAAYAELEQARYGRSWDTNEIALGFIGDVGDLAKLVIAQNCGRDIPVTHAKLAHELSDCLWSIIVLANHYHIDLEAAFFETMNKISAHIEKASSEEVNSKEKKNSQ